MRRLLVISLFISSQFLSAQTYFHINSLSIDPAFPSPQDQVLCTVQGDLSSTGAYIVETVVLVEGSQITITINAADPGGADVLVPHAEEIEISQLAAGTYTIIISGNNVDDLAPGPEHEFTVSGGSNCDSLQIISLTYEAFGDSLIVVWLSDSSAEQLSFPGLILFNALGDTIAVGEPGWSSIGTISGHLLLIHPTADLTVPTFNGILEIWTTSYDSLICTFPMEVALCPENCAEIIPFLYHSGGPITYTAFDYSIHDSDGSAIATGIFELTDTTSIASDTLCLPPGHYSMQVQEVTEPVAAVYFYGVHTPGNASIPNAITEPPNITPFAFFPHCIEIIETVGSIGYDATTFRFIQTVDHLLIEDQHGPLGNISLIDLRGAMISSIFSNENSAFIPLDGLTSGMYLVNIQREHTEPHLHRFVIAHSR